MVGPLRCVLVAGMLLACNPGEIDAPDAATGGSGLVVRWSSRPATWPGTIASGVTIERATFALDSLRVIGDAGPGDPRTTKSSFEVRWDDNTMPDDIAFDGAPTGLYSQVSVAIDGHLTTDSYELRGHAVVGGTDWEYRIDDDAPLAFTLQIEQMLAPGATATVKLNVDFTAALASLDFSSLNVDEGRLELTSSDPGIVAFRQQLAASFEIDASAPN